MAAFNPDRWLKTEVDGSKVFDATLGPQMSFGAGHADVLDASSPISK
jgi:hypothetical protein